METDPIAYFLTWTCYGTWLPGDDRGWTAWHRGDQVAQPLLADWCRDRLGEQPVMLTLDQRELVNDTVSAHCGRRGWLLHGVNCRSNHCHAVISAPAHSGVLVRDQLKAWSTRRLKEQEQVMSPTANARDKWWSRNGSVRYLFDDESLQAAVLYCNEAQDKGGSKAFD